MLTKCIIKLWEKKKNLVQEIRSGTTENSQKSVVNPAKGSYRIFSCTKNERKTGVVQSYLEVLDWNINTLTSWNKNSQLFEIIEVT